MRKPKSRSGFRVAGVPLVPAEVGDKPKSLIAIWACIGPLPCMYSNVLRPRPCPLEGLLTAFPRALEGPLVQVNAPMLQEIFVHEELLPASLERTPIALVDLQIRIGRKAHATPVDIAKEIAVVHDWFSDWYPFLLRFRLFLRLGNLLFWLTGLSIILFFVGCHLIQSRGRSRTFKSTPCKGSKA